jgi:hypothetical protein
MPGKKSKRNMIGETMKCYSRRGISEMQSDKY